MPRILRIVGEIKVEIDLSIMVEELNSLAEGYRVGNLQQIRRRIQCKSGNYRGMRMQVRKKSDWFALHWGGRKELQFNLGIVDDPRGPRIRYGVAFSFEPSRNYPFNELRDVLEPKVSRFNEYLRVHKDRFPSMKMWDEIDGKRENESQPSPIRTDRFKKGLFIFFGRICTPDNWNSHKVLTTFDELLPLYEYVEGDGYSSLKFHRRDETGFSFKPGCTIKPSRIIAKLYPGISNIRLRHNDMQLTLHDKLASKYGKDNVGTENPSGNGLPIDVVVQNDDDTYSFYEIKTSHDPRICIREAIGQLLEYAYWNNRGPQVKNLVIVGPNPMDDAAEKYLTELKERYDLPISYDHHPIPD